MRFVLLLFLFFAVQIPSAKAQVTYSKDIAPIIYNNCTSCHRPGEIGPMPLTNFEEVSSWSGMIEYVTAIKYMPPWKPNKEYSNFVGERGLTDSEIELIADWVAAGSPQGDPALEPPLPDFPDGSQLGTPDLILEMEEEYFIEGNNQDDYRVFVIPTGLTEDKEIAAVEFRPGNTKAVHHALIAYEINGEAAERDAATPGYGYEEFGGFGVPVQGNFIGYTPGISPVKFPPGIGTTLPAGADMLLQVHYAPLPVDQTDKSLINIFYKDAEDPIEREIERSPGSPFDLPGGILSFVIPPEEVKTFNGVKEIEEDISLLSVYPHCHYLGQDWEIFARTATGDTINIIRIDEWDFNWQGAYTFDRMKKIPAGSRLHINATYDNTSANPFNPSSPPQMMRWGEGTTDEMYLVGINHVPYEDGDENIVVGGTVTSNTEVDQASNLNRLAPPFPNPSKDVASINYYLHENQKVNLEMLDVKGRGVKVIIQNEHQRSGSHTVEVNHSKLPAGTYTIRLSGNNFVLSTPLIVVK